MLAYFCCIFKHLVLWIGVIAFHPGILNELQILTNEVSLKWETESEQAQ